MAYSRICISSGHGLYVRGASGNPGLDEVDEARALVDYLATVLEERGCAVLTFHDDESKTQDENLKRIVNWHNGCGAHDLDISVHFNAYNTQAHGTEVCYVSQGNLAAELSAEIAAAGSFTNRGAKHRTDLFVLNNTKAPCVLLEICFCDNPEDAAKYEQHFQGICEAIADVLVDDEGDGDVIIPEPPLPVEHLFEVTGRCSYFGGPDDMGVSDSEGLAFHYAITEANQHLFLPFQPVGTTGLARRLNAKAVHYIACRWDYNVTSKEMLAGEDVALVTNVETGMAQTAFPSDWGPHEEKTGRAADLSPALMRDLGLVTDDVVNVIYPWREP